MATGTSISDLKGEDVTAAATTPAHHTERDNTEISILDLLIVLAERKRTILWITVAFAIVAIIVSLILPVRYTATVILLPPQQNSSLSSALTSQLGSMGGIAALATGGSSLLKNPNDMYVAMLKSRTVEDAMVQHFNLMQEFHQKYLSDACKELESRASIDGSGKDGLIHISFEDHNPQRAADLANGYVEQFRNLSQNMAITEAAQRRLFFEEQMKQASQNLADAEEALKETEQKTGLIQLDSQARALIEAAGALRAQISAKEVQIQSMQTFATGENPQLIQAEQELSSLRAQLAKLGGSDESTDGIIVPKGQMTGASLEYARKLRDVKYYETIFDILARQFELAKLDEAKEGALIQVVDPAIPPDKKSSPKRGLIVIAATAIGFFIGIFLALIQAGLQILKADPESALKLAILHKSI